MSTSTGQWNVVFASVNKHGTSRSRRSRDGVETVPRRDANGDIHGLAGRRPALEPLQVLWGDFLHSHAAHLKEPVREDSGPALIPSPRVSVKRKAPPRPDARGSR